MQIECTTTSAAAQVLRILLFANLRPARDFEVRPILTLEAPFIFTIRGTLPSAQMPKLHALADTTIIVG
jgi:hypothetical protein